MMSSGSTTQTPRSAYDRTRGLVYFARMLDKIRLYAAGRLRADFHANLGQGFDARCCCFLGVDYSVLRARVLAGGSDEEILQWCLACGCRHEQEFNSRKGSGATLHQTSTNAGNQS